MNEDLVPRRWKILLSAAIAIFGLGAIVLSAHYSDPNSFLDSHQTLVRAPSKVAANSNAALRLLVGNVDASGPVANSRVVVTAYSKDNDRRFSLFEGKTNAGGAADVNFRLPKDMRGGYQLILETQSPGGSDRLETPIQVESAIDVLLTSDKPLYQPGQTIHLRALCLQRFDRKPAVGESALLEVEDPKGNKVFKKRLKTSEWGIVSADFILGREINLGRYRIRAIFGDTEVEKVVTVQGYVLPKFKVNLETDRAYYLPRQRVSGSLNARYFFGKSVSNGNVEITLHTFDMAFNQFARIAGRTDAEGNFAFNAPLPDYFVGQPLEQGNALLRIDASVTDAANHQQRISRTFPVVAQPINVSLIPEAGTLAPSVENVVYVVTSYPNGSPAPAQFAVNHSGRNFNGRTDAAGVGEFRFTPASSAAFRVQVADSRGNHAEREETLRIGPALLVRPDRGLHQVGERMNVDVLCGAGTVYLDIVKSGQTLLTQTLTPKNGRARFSLALTPEHAGTLTLSAYQMNFGASTIGVVEERPFFNSNSIATSGETMRSQAMVFVEQAGDLGIMVRSDKETYRPGEPGKIDFEVTDRSSNEPVAAALGITIVDESVFALQEMQPGMEKVYFALQKDILQPRYQIKYALPGAFDLPSLIREVPMQAARRERTERLMRVSFAARNASLLSDAATGMASTMPVRIDSYAEKRKNAAERRRRYNEVFPKVYGSLASLIFLVCFVGSVIAGAAIRREPWWKHLLGTGAAAVGFAILLVLLGSLWYLWHWAASPYGGPGSDVAVALPILLIAIGLTTLPPAIVALWRWLKKRQVLTYIRFGFSGVLGIAAVALTLLTAFSGSPWSPALTPSLVVGTALLGLGIVAIWSVRAFPAWSILAGMFFLVFVPVFSVARQKARDVFVQVNTRMTSTNGLMDTFSAGAAAAPMSAEKAEVKAVRPQQKGQADPAAPRLRQFFPETLLAQPALITDEQGKATLDLTLADSITTWRLTALANSATGLLGSTTAPLRVFQDFFVDLDLPVALTQADEVSIPVALYNYLPTAQTVRLELKKAPWFDMATGMNEPSSATRSVTLQANEVSVVHFPIRAKAVGRHALTVTAYGSALSDAIRKEVEILPNGKEFVTAQSDRLTRDATTKCTIPSSAIPGASRMIVKIYPGVFSQVVEGLDTLLQAPFG